MPCPERQPYRSIIAVTGPIITPAVIGVKNFDGQSRFGPSCAVRPEGQHADSKLSLGTLSVPFPLETGLAIFS